MRQVICGVTGELTTLPGCTQVAVSHSVFMPESLRGQGIGTRANKERCDEAHRLGYDYVLCTVDAANHGQVHVLHKNGWACLSSFQSRKTGHEVLLWGKRLETTT